MNQLQDTARSGGKRMANLGILLGIKLFFVGLIMVMGGSAARSLAKE